MSELEREKGSPQVADAPLEAFVTNLGKYNEGELAGEWLKLPTTPEQLMQTFRNIGIDGKQYEEYFITDYNTDIDGLYEPLPEYANLDELNYLAAKLSDMSAYDLDRYQAVLSYQGAGSVADLINLTESLDSFDILLDVHTEEDLGYYWIEDAGVYDLKSMGNLANYIDYERFGRDIMLDEGGSFTDHGYIRDNGDGISNEYDGLNVPDEYRIMRLPEDEPDMVHGYEIQKSIVFTNDRGFALAENPNAVQPFVTWQLTENEDGSRDYYWGHYFSEKDSAIKDFHSRVDEYRKDYGLEEKGAEPQPIAPDDFLTGEKIKTPRGSFSLASMSKEQMEAAGYGYHHSSDDGRYHIMGNGTRAFAIFNEEMTHDSYLKAAEMTVEQNYNQIDRLINNEPPPGDDLTDGQTFEEIQELAPEALPDAGAGKPSIKAMLRDCADEAKAAAPALKPTKAADLELE